MRTFLERDLPQLGFRAPAATYRRFWTMLAHTHGGILNASEMGNSLGQAHTTVKRHLDNLCGALVVRQLTPWFANIGKRQVKSPKVYVRDSGILHTLLGIPSLASLESHPKLGASFEGLVVEHVVSVVGERNAFFWATPAGAELDLLLTVGGARYVLTVVLAADGKTQIDDRPAPSDEAILADARVARAKNPEVRAVIKADSAVSHGRVIHVLDLLKQAQIAKIAFGVSPTGPASALP